MYVTWLSLFKFDYCLSALFVLGKGSFGVGLWVFWVDFCFVFFGFGFTCLGWGMYGVWLVF